MIPIDRVTCPVDLSPASAGALRHAATWALRHDAPLHVLHIAQPQQWLVSGDAQAVALPSRPLHLVRADVEQFVGATLSGESRPTIEVYSGDPVTAILEEAARHPRGLMVMGTHGWSGLDRVLLGSVTERVARGVACPLLVVPPHEIVGPLAGLALERILCAVDFQPSSLTGLDYALALAYAGGARVELVTVFEPHLDRDLLNDVMASEGASAHRRALLEALRQRVPHEARQWCHVHEDVLRGAPAEALLTCADDIRAELIVIGTGDRPHLHALWLGSTAGRLMRSSRCPVLIVPGTPRAVAGQFAPAIAQPRLTMRLEAGGGEA